jgi:tetratricopeptide (TPR) repeat protein
MSETRSHDDIRRRSALARDCGTRSNVRTVVLASLAFASIASGCGGAYEVVRVHEGRARAERYVSPEAYADSLEASLAESRGDFVAAEEWLRKARDEDPDAPDLQARYGFALCRIGKREAAMFAFGDALRSDPRLELAYTLRARCRLLGTRDAATLADARRDLERAVESDPDAIEPALALIDLDVASGDLARARARAEELATSHPSSASVMRVLAEVAARQGDVGRAVQATRIASALDAQEGARARASVLPIADASAVSAYGLAVRGRPRELAAQATAEGACATVLAGFEAIASRSEPDEIAVAADAARTECPALDGEITLVEARATWSPTRGEAVEARALASTSPAARRWALRMRLRRVATDRLLESGGLPPADDRESLALPVAAGALRRARSSPKEADIPGIVEAARTLAPAEPTVARLCAATGRAIGGPAASRWREAACALARTSVERADCGS